MSCYLFSVGSEIMLILNNAVPESIIRYGISAWYGSLTVMKLKGKRDYLSPLKPPMTEWWSERTYHISYSKNVKYDFQVDATEPADVKSTVLSFPLSQLLLRYSINNQLNLHSLSSAEVL